MADTCPDLSHLRALAEPQGLAGIFSPAESARIETHVAACKACRQKIELAKTEDAALRALATPFTPDRNALEATLAAVKQASAGSKPNVRRSKSPGLRPASSAVPWAAIAVVLAATGVGIAIALRSNQVEPSPSASSSAPAPSNTTGVRELTSSPRPSSPKETKQPESAKTPEHEETKTPEENVPGPSPQVAPSPVASETPAVVAEASPTPKASESTLARVLARARSDKLAIKGRRLTQDAVIPEGLTIEAVDTASVEGEGTATLALAPKSSFTVSKASNGSVLFTIVSGRATVTTTGDAPYAVASNDVSVTPVASPLARSEPKRPVFVFALEGDRSSVAVNQGAVRVDARKPSPADLSLVVLPGFTSTTKGHVLALPRPTSSKRILREISVENDRKLVTEGTVSPADATSAVPYVTGVPGEGAARVIRFADKPLTTADPGSLVEVTLRVSKKVEVELLAYDETSKDHMSASAVVEPGRFTTLVLPLRDFSPKSKNTRALEKGDALSFLAIKAGGSSDALELHVASVRFFSQEK